MTNTRVITRAELVPLIKRSFVQYAHVEDSWLRPNLNYAISRGNSVLSSGGVAVVNNAESGSVNGWAIGNFGPLFWHSPEQCLTVVYAHTFVSSIRAVRTVLDLHRAMIVEAERRGVALVVSSSYLDNADVFNRILVSDGWTKRGDICVYRVTEAKHARWHQGPSRLPVRRNKMTVHPAGVVEKTARWRDTNKENTHYEI